MPTAPSLNPVQRLAVRRGRLEGLSFRRIAALVGCTERTVINLTRVLHDFDQRDLDGSLSRHTLTEVGLPEHDLAAFGSLSAAAATLIAGHQEERRV